MNSYQSLIISGLILNLIGGLLLGMQILGVSRIKKVERWFREEFTTLQILSDFGRRALLYRIIGGYYIPIKAPTDIDSIWEGKTTARLYRMMGGLYMVQDKDTGGKPILVRHLWLYHYLPILLITWLSIWFVLFFGFHLSVTKGLVLALLLSMLAFSQETYIYLQDWLNWATRWSLVSAEANMIGKRGNLS